MLDSVLTIGGNSEYYEGTCFKNMDAVIQMLSTAHMSTFDQ